MLTRRTFTTFAAMFICGFSKASESMTMTEGAIDSLNPNAIWWTYLAKYEGLTGSTRVNMALRSGAPYSSFPYLVVLGTSYMSSRADKLPEESELNFLNEVSDELILSVMRLGPSLYAGTFTNDLEQVHFIYVQKLDGAKVAFNKAHSVLCDSRTAIWIEQEDSHWKQYLDFLCPNQAIMEFYGYDLGKLQVKADTR